MTRFVARRSSWLPGHDDMAIFDLGVSVFGLMVLTNKVVLLAIKVSDGPA